MSATTKPSPCAGFAVLVIDYRGFGDSEGDRDVILPIAKSRI